MCSIFLCSKICNSEYHNIYYFFTDGKDNKKKDFPKNSINLKYARKNLFWFLDNLGFLR